MTQDKPIDAVAEEWIQRNFQIIACMDSDHAQLMIDAEDLRAFLSKYALADREREITIPRFEVEKLIQLLRSVAHPHPQPHADYLEGLLSAHQQGQEGE